ncbi:cache domain-containing protein [Micromonospora sp. WMMD734]|uniref:histidine kinase n=1 Tax=Micromonospora humidisoli TaxID=2807622 RepID=A0ABS2JCM1_9ACTN|nr:cache domain-containing protein [Micromonospora humidisoli]MBM7083569.1 cache domain-containing protein [Micromonospora humidisoli]
MNHPPPPPPGRAGLHHPEDGPGELARWRLISLEKQLPQPRLLTGVGTPALVAALLLTLLAVFAFGYLGRDNETGVPRAVTDSQRDFVGAVARGLDSSVARSREELTRTAAAYDARPAGAATQLAALTTDQPKWRGVGILDAGGKSTVAAVGRPVTPPPGAATGRIAVPVVEGNDPRLLLVEPLSDGRLLVAELNLHIRTLRLDPKARQAVLIAVPGGGRSLVQGAPVPADPALDALIAGAVGATSGVPTATRTGVPAAGPADRDPTVPVAPVATADAVGKVGVVVVSLVYVPVTAAAVTREPLLAALALLVGAGAVLLTLQFGLVRPMRLLLVHAKAVASGNPVQGWPRTANAQVNRIASAFGRLAAQQRTTPAQRGPDDPAGGVPAGLVVVTAVVAVLLAAGGILATLAPHEDDLPAQVVRDSENQVAAVAGAVDDTLDGGYTKLALIGADNRTAGTAQLRRVLDRLLDDNRRFRSGYLASANGSVITSVGRAPLRPGGPLPGEGGVVLHDVQGRLPIVYAYTQLADGRSLVAEFDVRYLTRLLERVDGRLRVVDVDQRDILDSAGYLAFEQVSSGQVRTAAAEALSGRPYARVAEVDGDRELLIAAPVALEGSAAHLEWTVVAERPVTDYALPGNEMRQGALLVAVVAAGIGLLLFSWYYFFQLRPLRNLSREAATLAGGDSSRVISPRWHDDIGAVAVCLEVCRQAAVHGEQRLGGAARLRGTEGMPTAIMTKIPPRRKAGSRGVRSSRRGD